MAPLSFDVRTVGYNIAVQPAPLTGEGQKSEKRLFDV